MQVSPECCWDVVRTTRLSPESPWPYNRGRPVRHPEAWSQLSCYSYCSSLVTTSTSLIRIYSVLFPRIFAHLSSQRPHASPHHHICITNYHHGLFRLCDKNSPRSRQDTSHSRARHHSNTHRDLNLNRPRQIPKTHRLRQP